MNDDPEQEIDLWIYRASFWMQVAYMSAVRNIAQGFESGPQSTILKTLVRSHIFAGLENGFFDNGGSQDDDEYDQLIEEDEPRMPWSIVVRIAGDVEVDATEVLQDYIRHTQDGLQRALGLAGANLEEMGPTFVGVPISAQMAHEIADGQFGSEFEKKFADRYILHVMHGAKPCQHPYESIDMAIEGAATDLQRGIVSDISHITYNGALVLHEDEVRRRVAEIGNAGLN